MAIVASANSVPSVVASASSDASGFASGLRRVMARPTAKVAPTNSASMIRRQSSVRQIAEPFVKIRQVEQRQRRHLVAAVSMQRAQQVVVECGSWVGAARAVQSLLGAGQISGHQVVERLAAESGWSQLPFTCVRCQPCQGGSPLEVGFEQGRALQVCRSLLVLALGGEQFRQLLEHLARCSGESRGGAE